MNRGLTAFCGGIGAETGMINPGSGRFVAGVGPLTSRGRGPGFLGSEMPQVAQGVKGNAEENGVIDNEDSDAAGCEILADIAKQDGDDGTSSMNPGTKPSSSAMRRISVNATGRGHRSQKSTMTRGRLKPTVRFAPVSTPRSWPSTAGRYSSRQPTLRRPLSRGTSRWGYCVLCLT